MKDDRAATTHALIRPAARRSEIAPFIVMDVISAAARLEAQGRHIIHMEVGQPGTPAPRMAREAITQRIDSDTLGYTEALGIPGLRRRIAQYYREFYGVEVASDRVIVTTGSSAAFLLAFLALFDAGDRVGLPSPGYPCYRHILSSLGITPAIIETGPETRWMPTAEQVEAESAVRGLAGLLIASPANPTGSMLEPGRLAQIVETCRRQRIWFISDEIYHGLTWTFPSRTALEHSSDVIVINSFSKYFSMTGWRIGWMVVPAGLVRTVERLAQNLFISPPAVSQAAALAAFEAGAELEANRAAYDANRRLLLAELPRFGLERIVPADGAFYLYVDVGRFTQDSVAFTRAMLDEAGIAATPGVDFDEARGARFMRLSYSGTTTDMEEAIERLKKWPRLKA